MRAIATGQGAPDSIGILGPSDERSRTEMLRARSHWRAPGGLRAQD